MSEQDHGRDNGRGKNGEGGTENEFYDIDETVVLEGEGNFRHYSWPLSVEDGGSAKAVIRAISRTDHPFNTYVVPEDELEYLENGEEFWREYYDSRSKKLSDTFEFGGKDEKPYRHSDKYRLVVTMNDSNWRKEPKLTMKFRIEK